MRPCGVLQYEYGSVRGSEGVEHALSLQSPLSPVRACDRKPLQIHTDPDSGPYGGAKEIRVLNLRFMDEPWSTVELPYRKHGHLPAADRSPLRERRLLTVETQPGDASSSRQRNSQVTPNRAVPLAITPSSFTR